MSKLIILLGGLILVLSACEKVIPEDDTGTETPKDTILTPLILKGNGTNGSNARPWYVQVLSKRYYNRNNELDSAIEKKPFRPIDCYIVFRLQDGYTGGGMDIAESPQNRILAPTLFAGTLGNSWYLSKKGDTLLVSYPRGDFMNPEFIDKPFIVKFTRGAGIPYLYKVEATYTEAAPNGGKIVEAFTVTN